MNEGQAKRASERKARYSIIEFAIENLQSDDFRRWVEEAGRRRAHEAKERSFRADDETAIVGRGVKAQEKKVRVEEPRLVQAG